MITNLPLALTCIAVGLFVIGERRAVVLTGRPRDAGARRRARYFYGGVATVLVALESPLDRLAESYFWAHMLQHLLLLLVAPALIVAARPWMSLWRPLPLGARRWMLRSFTRARWASPLRLIARALSSPVGAWLSFTGAMVIWHMPALYDLTLRNLDVHVLEHTVFLGVGILFWGQVFALAPARPRLGAGARALFAAAAVIPNMCLSVYLTYVGHALYSPYVLSAAAHPGLSALGDQQIGAGLMWTLGDFPFVIAAALLAVRWMGENEARSTTVEGMLAGQLAAKARTRA